MARVALTGGAYEARSVVASAQRSLNLFAEPMPEQQGESMPAAHYPTPGTTLFGTIGSGPVRGIRQTPDGAIYVVSGSGVYLINDAVFPWAGTLLGSISPGITTPVSMQDNGLDLIIVDGTGNGWDVTLGTNAFTPIPTTSIQTPAVASTTLAITAGIALYTQFTSPISGVASSVTVSLATGYTGNLQCALFADSGGTPGAALGLVANVVTNPIAGANTVIFATPVTMAAGTRYWFGADSDTSAGSWSVGSGSAGFSSNTPYDSFPADNPVTTAGAPLACAVTISNDPNGVFAGADRVDYLDTFLLFNKPATPQFYISGSLAVTFDPLDFANKESYSDLLVTLCVAKREVWLLGQRTTEIWYNAGATDTGAGSFPFAEVQSVFVDHGIAAKYSVANYDNSVFWLTQDRQGQGFVMMGAGYQTQRVSTYAIEAEISGYASISDAIGFCYQLAGHTFYVLTFPTADKTWCYDVGTKLWHQWAWIDSNGGEHRHRANCFWPCFQWLVVGDWQNGNLYALQNDVYTDNGQPIKRLRSFPHMLADGKRVFYREFHADLETGNPGPSDPITGVSNGPLGREDGTAYLREDGTQLMREDAPGTVVSLRWSDDRGHTYGSPVLQEAGAPGQYLTSCQWQRLGYARDRVWELSWSTSVKRVLQGAWLEAQPGMS